MLPAAASFKKQGANKGALASFLVSTPESGIDSIAITYALLDPIMTVARPVAAFVTGISAGFLENSLGSDDLKEPAASTENESAAAVEPSGSKPEHQGSKVMAGMRYAFGEVWGSISLWFFTGLLLAGIITVYIPNDLSEMVLGGGILSMLAMLVIGMPLYICATASTPVAAALLLKGASPGVVLVFLLVGPATNMTSLAVLFRILGRMGTLRYLLVIAVVSILFGLGLDELYKYLNIEIRAVITEIRETLPHWLKLGSAILLLVMTSYQGYKWYQLRKMKNSSNQFITGFPDLNQGIQRKELNKPVPVTVETAGHSFTGNKIIRDE